MFKRRRVLKNVLLVFLVITTAAIASIAVQFRKPRDIPRVMPDASSSYAARKSSPENGAAQLEAMLSATLLQQWQPARKVLEKHVERAWGEMLPGGYAPMHSDSVLRPTLYSQVQLEGHSNFVGGCWLQGDVLANAAIVPLRTNDPSLPSTVMALLDGKAYFLDANAGRYVLPWLLLLMATDAGLPVEERIALLQLAADCAFRFMPDSNSYVYQNEYHAKAGWEPQFLYTCYWEACSQAAQLAGTSNPDVYHAFAPPAIAPEMCQQWLRDVWVSLDETPPLSEQIPGTGFGPALRHFLLSNVEADVRTQVGEQREKILALTGQPLREMRAFLHNLSLATMHRVGSNAFMNSWHYPYVTAAWNIARGASLLEAKRRGLTMVFAVESYRGSQGAYPGNAADALGPAGAGAMPDPISGDTLRAVSSAAGYTVYSIGEDGTDNAGDPEEDVVLYRVPPLPPAPSQVVRMR